MPTVLQHLRRHFTAQIREISGDLALTRYGAALGLIETLTAFWGWRHIGQAVSERAAICWPFFQSCDDFRVLGTNGLIGWIVLIGVLGVLACVAFSCGRIRVGYVALVFATLLKIGFVLLDFRLRRNQHYMAAAVSLLFLLWPYKRDAIRLLIVGFYFWAGVLKLNLEWLSGAALYRPVWLFEGQWLYFACAYVVVLELLLVWGLLGRRPWIFWSVLAQLGVFHIFSWPVVGYFYPILMGIILLIHPFARWWPADDDVFPPLFVRMRAGGVAYSSYVPFVIFALLQVGPAVVFPGDTALTGEGRFLSLHMFDSRPVCERSVITRSVSGEATHVDPLRAPVRIRCDPWLLFAQASAFCRTREEEPERGIADVDIYLASRRSSQESLRVVVDEKNICARGLHYDWWRHNDWIRPLRLGAD